MNFHRNWDEERDSEIVEAHVAACHKKMEHFASEPPPDLESAVISAAIRFRKAETEMWIQSEVGSVESAEAAKAERRQAYLAFVDAVDDLLRSRGEK